MASPVVCYVGGGLWIVECRPLGFSKLQNSIHSDSVGGHDAGCTNNEQYLNVTQR